MTTYLSPGVYVEEVDRGSKPIEGVGTAVAAFVGFTATPPAVRPEDPAPRLVTNWSQYTALYGGFSPGAMLPQAVYGFFSNGGGSCYIVRVPSGTHGGADDGRSQMAQGARLTLRSGTRSDLETLHLTAVQPGGPLEVVVELAQPAAEGDSGGEQASSFTLKINAGDRQLESFPNLTFSRGSQNVETQVNASSQYVRVEVPTAQGIAAADRIPSAGTFTLEATPVSPATVSSQDFEGDASRRTGIKGLVIAEDVTMVAVPDLVTAATVDGELDLDAYRAVQSALIDHCEASGNRMAILDAPPKMEPDQIRRWRTDEAGYDAKFAAMYYPWLEVRDPHARPGANGGAMLMVPPCGHLAGIWARNDATRGVWKAPANEVVRGALGLERTITKGEQDILNPIGVNCIRSMGTRGLRVWGARTLSSNASWRYVNVRRLFNYVEESILAGTQWIVFEPNDLDLWQRVKRTIYAFLVQLWRQGALFGATPEQAFYVKCDAETNPPESIDEGKLVVEIGLAPVKPAEFVIIRISQWQGGGGAAAE